MWIITYILVNIYSLSVIWLLHDDRFSKCSILVTMTMFQAVFSDINPFIYGEDENPMVNSSVVIFGLSSCSSKIQAKGNSTIPTDDIVKDIPDGPLAPAVPFEIALVPKGVHNATCQKIKPTDVYKMVYHVFNVSEPAKPLQINIYPRGQEILDVFINVFKLPTPTRHIWNFTFPKEKPQEVGPVSGSETTSKDAANAATAKKDEELYTIILQPEELEAVLNVTFSNETEKNETGSDLDESVVLTNSDGKDTNNTDSNRASITTERDSLLPTTSTPTTTTKTTTVLQTTKADFPTTLKATTENLPTTERIISRDNSNLTENDSHVTLNIDLTTDGNTTGNYSDMWIPEDNRSLIIGIRRAEPGRAHSVFLFEWLI